MTHLIDKSALVAEIKKRGYYAQTMSDNAINGNMRLFCDGMIECCQQLFVFLDTFEMKEVDLEKSISDWLSEGLPNDEELIDYIKETAEHFFKLGMQQSKNDNNYEEKK